MEALSQIVVKGDAQAITTVTARCQDSERYVREAAALALPLVVDDKGVPPAIVANGALEMRQKRLVHRSLPSDPLGQIFQSSRIASS